MSGSNEKFERDFESFLSDDDSRLAALYRKLPQAEPDARLDAAVRAQAHHAIAATPARAPVTARRNWMPVFGVAAVVALAVGFAFRLGPQLWQRPASQPEAQPMAIPAAQPPAVPQPAETAPVAQKAAAADSAGTAVPESRAPVAELEKAENAASRPAPHAFPTSARAMQRVAAPPPPAAEAKPAMQAPAMAEPMRAKRVETESAGAPAAALAAPATQDRNASLYPEHWLANIRQMLRDNRREEALRSLAEFRKRYPDYRLPDDLRDLH